MLRGYLSYGQLYDKIVVHKAVCPTVRLSKFPRSLQRPGGEKWTSFCNSFNGVRS